MFESIAMHDLQEIQFLEFMGESNLTHAHSNFLTAFYSNKYGTTLICHKWLGHREADGVELKD